MTTPTGQPPSHNPLQAAQAPAPAAGRENEDGVSIRGMRLKVLYTFDDQNKTNCLARWPHVLQVQTVAMDEATCIGVIELKTCIDAIVQCSPELVARLGQDYTVYAYDYSEYDNPLVGQGMLSKALSTASPTPDAPASQSRQLITGRVCKNIMGIFAGGIKETLEVKLRLVPVPTTLQGEYQNTMERYREMNKAGPPGFDPNEWNSFIQSNPNLGQVAKKLSPAPVTNLNMRDGMSMEVMNQLLSPSLQQQNMPDPPNQPQFSKQPPDQQQPQYNQKPQYNQQPLSNQQSSFRQQSSFANQNPFNPVSGFTPVITENSGNEVRGPSSAGEKTKKTSRPSSRVSVKRPRARKSKATSVAKGTAAAAGGGNTSGYEEGTDGDDGPVSKKRAKVTKTNWKGNTLGTKSDSLRVAAGTSGGLRLLRPVAISPYPPGGRPQGSHLVEIARAPTPVPHVQSQHVPRNQGSLRSSLRQDSVSSQSLLQNQDRLSPYPHLQNPEDQVRRSIESIHPSPERFSPGGTPPEIGSSPPVMRTRPPSTIRSSPPCPSSPVLPQMPRTDSGFMSGSVEDLFGEDEVTRPAQEEDLEVLTQEEWEIRAARRRAQYPLEGSDFNMVIQEEQPGPPELLPTRMPEFETQKRVGGKARAADRLKNGSVVSENGQALPPLKHSSHGPIRRAMSQPDVKTVPYQTQNSSLGPGALNTYSPAPEPQPHHQAMSQPPPEIPKNIGTMAPKPQPLIPPISPSPRAATDLTPVPKAQTHHMGPIEASKFALPTSVDSQTTLGAKNAPINTQNSATASAPTQANVPTFAPGPASLSRPTSRSGTMVRTASTGSLTLPQAPASDPVMPRCILQRSQTWTGAPHPASEVPIPPPGYMLQQIHLPGPPNNYGHPATKIIASKKSLARQKIEDAIARGEMPPFCSNCGAVETPTWRKAWSQDLDGEPGYHEYSDKPGCVTAIIILERDSAGKPTKYKLVKKFLGAGEQQGQFDEFVLCNPCGLWMSKYKTQRPENRWESNGWKERARGDKRKSVAQKAKMGQAGFPTSESNFPLPDFPYSDANLPHSGVSMQMSGVATVETRVQQAPPENLEVNTRERSTSVQPKKRLNAMTSNAASAALRRAIQSSPARWAAGTQQSPIDIQEELGTTRRLLFPSPRKEGSSKVLGEAAINIVATDIRSPKEIIAEVQAHNKENCPPAINDEDIDAELLQLFEEEMAKGDDIERPSTPEQKTPIANPFKTPTRRTPSHRPITRSVSRSIRSAQSVRSARSLKSPSQLLFTRTPTRTPCSVRRSPRNHDGVFESPFTATLNQMMSEANSQNSPARHNVDIDFGSLPDLSNIDDNNNVDMDFSLEDFFSTDVPMPSSPPQLFNLYEDPAIGEMNVDSVNWEEFAKFNHRVLQADEDEVMLIKEEPEASPRKVSDACEQENGA
ncbi:unnamed protein product [Diplocarpon coronariae]|uniref:GATA transcription factor (Ams2) n=1 Tax=Diplocarpon coronariae TaxID=2795749 RepID=A0A218ZG02_9HELO|nr:GATA transcription factor (Ams2) [Marssonina coronariae]